MTAQSKALRTLLEEEREALLNADFSRLSRLADRKEQLLEAIATVGQDEDNLVPIRNALGRNAALLQAAQAGLQAARAALSGERPAAAMTVYARDGGCHSMHNRRPGLHHKA